MIGKTLREAREELGYSRQEFADLCFIDRSSVSRIESDKQLPARSKLRNIMVQLGLPESVQRRIWTRAARLRHITNHKRGNNRVRRDNP